MENRIIDNLDLDEAMCALRDAGSDDRYIAFAAQREIAKSLEIPLRKGVLSGDIIGNIFQQEKFEPGVYVEYPLDFLAPGTEREYVAYAVPSQGMMPQKFVEGDFVTMPTYEIGASIDWSLRYAKNARWNIVAKFMQVLESMFVKKLNDDGWHTLLMAGVDRNILVYDSDATQGQFTKRLVSLMKLVMRRNSGGNSTSVSRGKLTDLYMSPEAQEDIRNWGVDIIDEVTRREIYQLGDGGLTRLFGVNLHELDELGEDQEYQLYYLNELGAALQTSDRELVVGFDLSVNDSFVMPIRQELEIFEDDSLFRQRRQGYCGWMEIGFGVLDNRRVILGSF
jgi:hypothetical protein